ALPRLAAVGAPRILGRPTHVRRQFPLPKLPCHHVANPDHALFDVIDVLVLGIQSLGLLVRQHLCHQRLHALLNRLVSCHPWLPFLSSTFWGQRASQFTPQVEAEPRPPCKSRHAPSRQGR